MKGAAGDPAVEGISDDKDCVLCTVMKDGVCKAEFLVGEKGQFLRA
jgi:hypothetical protein